MLNPSPWFHVSFGYRPQIVGRLVFKERRPQLCEELQEMTYNCCVLLNAIVYLILQVYTHERDSHVLLNEPSSFGSKQSSSPSRSNGNYLCHLWYSFYANWDVFLPLILYWFCCCCLFMFRCTSRVWTTEPTQLSGAKGQTRFFFKLICFIFYYLKIKNLPIPSL